MPYFPSSPASTYIPTAATPHKKNWWEEIIGAPSALIGDVGSTLHGFGKAIPAVFGGLYHEGQNLGHGNFDAMWSAPRDTFTDLGHGLWEQYKQMYGPLFHGDVSTFGHNVLQHPLGPILDVLTVASAGLGAVGRGSRVIAGSSAFGKGTREAAAARAGLAAVKDESQFIPRVYDANTHKLIPDSRYVDTPPQDWAASGLESPEAIKATAIAAARRRHVNINGVDYLPKITEYRPQGKATANAFELTSAENPYNRYKSAKLAELGSKYPSAPLVGITGRASRQAIRLGGNPQRMALPYQSEILDKSNLPQELKQTVTHSVGTMQNPVKLAAQEKQLVNIGDRTPEEMKAIEDQARHIVHKQETSVHGGDNSAVDIHQALVEEMNAAKAKALEASNERAAAEANLTRVRGTKEGGASRHSAKVAKGIARVEKASDAHDAAMLAHESLRRDVASWRPYAVKGKNASHIALRKAENKALSELKYIIEGQVGKHAKIAGLKQNILAITSPYLKAVERWDYSKGADNSALIEELKKGMTEEDAARFDEVVTPKNMQKQLELRKAMIKAHAEVIIPSLERKWVMPKEISKKELASKARAVHRANPEMTYTEALDSVKKKTLHDVMATRAAAEHNKYLDILGKEPIPAEDFLSWARENVPGIPVDELQDFKPPFAITHMGHADTSGVTRSARFKDTLLGHEKKSTLYNAAWGLYNLDSPAALYRTMNTAIAAEMTARRMMVHLANGIDHPVGEAIPKGWETAIPGEVNKFIQGKLQTLLGFMSEDMRAMFGEDATNIELVQQVEDSLAHYLNDRIGGETVVIVPKGSAKVLFPEISKSESFIKRFYDNQSAWWRNYTLGLRPAWMVNNFMGNLMLLMAEHGTWNTIRSIIHGYGDKEFAKTINETSPELLHSGMNADIRAEEARRANARAMDPEAAKTALSHEEASTPMGTSLAKLGLTAQIINKANPLTALNRVGGRMVDFNAKWVDDPMRRAAAWAEVRLPAKDLQKKWLELRGEALPMNDAIKMILQDERVRDHIIQKSIGDMVNFSDLSNIEREHLRRVFPFWSWMSGITKRTTQLALDKPVKFNAYTKIGVYENQTQTVPGEKFLESYAPIGTPVNGMQKVLNTSGINPFSSAADTISMLNTILPGGGGYAAMKGTSSPLAQMNPLIKALIETGTGKDLFYGTPLREIQSAKDKKTGLPIGNPNMPILDLLASRYSQAFPQVSAVRKYQQPVTEQSLFGSTPGIQLANYFGYPVRNVNLKQALERKKKNDAALLLAQLAQNSG